MLDSIRTAMSLFPKPPRPDVLLVTPDQLETLRQLPRTEPPERFSILPPADLLGIPIQTATVSDFLATARALIGMGKRVILLDGADLPAAVRDGLAKLEASGTHDETDP